MGDRGKGKDKGKDKKKPPKAPTTGLRPHEQRAQEGATKRPLA